MNSFSINVLLVDDKKENIYSLQSLLEADHENDSINFLHATSGKEALKITLREEVALILLDVQMPEMDGYEVAHILKQNKSTENIPVIFVTALNPEASNMSEGYNHGAFDYLFKPLNPIVTRAKVMAFIRMFEYRKSNENLANLVNNSQDLMCILGEEMLDIQIMNPAWHTLLGYNIEGLSGTSFQNLLLNEEDKAELRIELKKTLYSKKSEYVFEAQIKSLIDNHKWISWNFIFKNGKWYISGKDITSRKNAENALENAHKDLTRAHDELIKLNNELETRVIERTRELATSRERFEAVALATNDILWDWDLSSNDIWWSEGFKNVLGYSEDDAMAGINSKFARIHPDEADKIISGLHKLIDSGEKFWSAEYKFKKEDGSYASILDRAYVLYDETRKPERVVGSMFDLSKFKKVQQQLNLINIELSNKNEELNRINKDMDNFIYTASHDLKAPVSNIEGLITTLDDIIDENLKDESYKGIIEMIKVSIERFKNTIKDLSEVAKADDDHKDIEETSFEEMVEEVKLHIHPQIIQSNAKIKCDFSNGNFVRYSRKNLRSIIYNLLSNAIKYRSDERSPEIEICTEIKEDFLLLSVKDNGLGIKEEDKDKVFTMFKRLHNHVEGTGVGMSIVKRIIDNNGGRIELDSEVGKGSNFKVYFKVNNNF